MSELGIQKNTSNFALFNLAFRPFFLGAAVSSIAAVIIWSLLYIYNGNISPYGVQASVWHAHEMLFAYGMAVIAGFLLTAIINWTGQQTITGKPLAGLFILWLLARVLIYFPDSIPLSLIAICDVAFLLGLLIAAAIPVIKAGQKKHAGLVLLLAVILISNILFYLGVLNILPEGMRQGLYTALFGILAIIFILARRVLPFFIKMGVKGNHEPVNRQWLDFAILPALFMLWMLELFFSERFIGAVIALALFALNSLRLFDWYNSDIWSKPLLWVLYVAYGFITIGFALSAAVYFFDVIPPVATHALTYGGIGLMTLGMMCRVILGHTGRNVFDPPRSLPWIFRLFILGALMRSLGPLLVSQLHSLWIIGSAVCWVLAMFWFLWVYFPMLVRPRIDGKPG